MPRKPNAMVKTAPRARKRKPRYNKKGGYKGHGNYTYYKPGPWGTAGRWIGKALGTHFAGAGGGKLGEALGGLLHFPAKLFGSGDYRVSPSKPLQYNTLVNSTQVPDFINYKNDFIRIRHHEYIGDIFTSSTAGAFSIQSFALNPGMSETFPYLSELTGGMFQQYRLNGVLFSYCSRSSDSLNSTNTALGSVILSTEYDSLDPVFSSRQEMENSQYAISCKPSENCVHGIECARSQTSVSELYMRSAAVPSGGDIRLYDHARFSIATQGFQAANVNIGSLYVTYDISFFKPIQPPPGFFTKMLHYNTAPTAAAPLTLDTSVDATQPHYDSFNSVYSISTTAIVFDPRKLQPRTCFVMNYSVRGDSTASVVGPAVTGTNGITISYIYQNFQSGGYTSPSAAATTTTINFSYCYYYDGSGSMASKPTLTFGTAGTFPANAKGDLIFLQIPSSQIVPP